MADWELSQLAVKAALAAATDYVPLLDTADHSTAPAGAGGSDKRALVASLNHRPSFSVLAYGADPTGAADSTAAFAAAYAAAAATLGGSTPGGYVTVPAGTYKLTAGSCVTSDPRIGLLGAGSQVTTVNVYGSGDAFYHYTASFNTGSNEGTTGLPVSGLTIDGTHTTGASTGLHVQDICSMRLDDLQIQNFTGGSNQTFTGGTPAIVTTGSSNGIRFTGNNNWSERLLLLGVRTSNCSVHLNFDGTTDPAGGVSFDYMRMLDCYSEIHPGQVGLMAQGFAQLDQPQLNYSYNMISQAAGAASYAVVIGPTDPSSELSRIRNALFAVRGEMDGSGSTCYGLRIGSWAELTGTGTWVNVGSMTAGALNSGSIFVSGYIKTPEFPANHALVTFPGGGASSGFYGGSISFACYTGQFVNTMGAKGLTLLDQAAGSSTVRSTLFSSAGNPGGVVGTNLSGDLYIRQDSLSAPNSQLWLATASNSNTWQPVVAAAIASGTATLAAGSVTVASTSITTSSIIRVHNISQAGTVGALSVSLTAGTSFTVHSTSGTDTSKVFWEVVSF